MMFAAGRFGNVVSDDSFLSVECFSFLSNILSICIATKRKNIGAGLGGAQPPLGKSIPHHFPLVLDLLQAHGDSTKSLRLSSLVPFAIRTYFVPSVRKSASYLGEGGVTVTDYSLFTHLDANIMFAPVLYLLHAHGAREIRNTVYTKTAG